MADTADYVTKEMIDAASQINHITTEGRVYDIVRDQLVALNEKTRQYAERRAEALKAAEALKPLPPGAIVGRPIGPQEYLGQQNAPFMQLPPPATPEPVPDQIPEFAAEQRDWYLEKCVSALQEANRIRRDEALMKEIRAFIRRKRDEVSNLLDEIG